MRAEAAVWTIMVPAVVVDPHRKETKTGVSPPFEQTAEFVLIGSAASGSGGSALAERHRGARPRARRPYRPQRPHVDGRGPVRQIALRELRHLWLKITGRRSYYRRKPFPFCDTWSCGRWSH